MEVKDILKLMRNNAVVKCKNGYISIPDIVKMSKYELSDLYTILYDAKIKLEKSKNLFEIDKKSNSELEKVNMFLELIEILAKIIKEDEKKLEKMKKLKELEKLAEQKKIESLDYKSIMKEIEKLKKEIE